MCFQELGAVVLLPMQDYVDGLAVTTMLLALNSLNDIRAYSSYAKLQQVKPNFGQCIAKCTESEILTTARLAGQPVPWAMIQKYYGTGGPAGAPYHPEVFDPHIQPEDLQWHKPEAVLARLAPELAFWQDTSGLALLHEDQPVSLNVLDVALSYCNHLPYADRIVHFMREHAWHQLMMRYLHQGNLEASLQRQLSAELISAPEVPLIE